MAETKKKKERYIIITDNSSVGITQATRLMVSQINEKIDQGYVPFGNLAVSEDEAGNPNFYQPMILKAPSK
ncbi:hypothetical protein [Candidatus Albibeggiatoa sp. nov. BB20]|uniref:hypothetical protein n=1 Tax=Candidatus Albibeggiatoa sp. nov. BB20 TaxID=3162723 RepID=UPI003365A087